MAEKRVQELIADYRDALVPMDGISLEEDRGARNWNALAHRVQRAQLRLRQSADGQAAITELIGDTVPTVAHWAASHALFWDEAKARRHLASARSTSAAATLREFDAGRLQHDWQPPKRG